MAAPPAQRGFGVRLALVALRVVHVVITIVLLTVVAVIGTISVMTARETAKFNHEITASMEPLIGVGDLVVHRPLTGADLRVGDIITFKRAGELGSTTHRVSALAKADDGGVLVTTKGDANPTDDPQKVVFDPDETVWLVTRSLPYIGTPVSQLMGGGGLPFILGLMPLYLLLPMLRRQVIKATEPPDPAKVEWSEPWDVLETTTTLLGDISVDRTTGQTTEKTTDQTTNQTTDRTTEVSQA